MKRKVAASLCAFLLLGLLLTGCSRAPLRLRVATASDLHYLAPSLNDHGEMFQRVMANGDGKLTEYCDEIVDAFLEELPKLGVEALILTGDLSFNGAAESHRALAEKLRAAEAAGTPVFVLPGNHDVYRGTAAAFFGDSYEIVPSVTGAEFREIYADFGYDEALSVAPDSFCYMAQLNDATRLLMLDCNTLHDPCGVSEETLGWVREQLELAKKDGMRVLAAGHQNLYQHSMFTTGYVIYGAQALAEEMRKAGVKVFLSGHMHIQHIVTEKGLTEIATSPLTMGACHYGILEAADGKIRYEARSVDMAAWAEKSGTQDENLLAFSEYAYEQMAARTREQTRGQLTSRTDGEDLEQMIEYAVALNWAYFSGDLRQAAALDPDGKMMERWTASGTLNGLYYQTIQAEFGRDYTHWEA